MNVDAMLEAYARNVAHEMRKNTTTSTSELRDYGDRHFSPLQFLGAFPADETPARTKHRCFYIQNTQDSSQDGEHWLGIGRQPGETDLLFDSFARKPSATWMPHLRGMELTEDDIDQWPVDSTHCGQLCLAFGHIMINHGYEAAKLC